MQRVKVIQPHSLPVTSASIYPLTLCLTFAQIVIFRTCPLLICQSLPYSTVERLYYSMMGCGTPLQIPIVLPSPCFRGNSLLPSGRPSSLSSSHFPFNGFLLCPFPISFSFAFSSVSPSPLADIILCALMLSYDSSFLLALFSCSSYLFC